MIGFLGSSDRGDIWRDFERILRDFDDAWPTPRHTRRSRSGFVEHEDRYELVLAAPGMKTEDVEAQVHGGLLSLRAHTESTPPEGYKATHRERTGYDYSYDYRLPTNADSERVSATLSDGVLTVVIPKVAEAQPKRIAVKAS